MARPLLLDLFCGAGGAAVGYHRAGFDVIGVDIKRQPRYPFPMVQADALDFLTWARLGRVAAIHASPPCQDHMRSHNWEMAGTGWMLEATRRQLQAIGKPWIIENVPGAALRTDLKLCGCMFGLPRLKRERWFETSPQLFDLRSPCQHREPVITICGNRWPAHEAAAARVALGVDWMTREEMGQAIPPAYTEYIGGMVKAIL